MHEATSMPALDAVTDALCAPQSLGAVLHRAPCDSSLMPSLHDLEELVSRLKAALFPGYFGSTRVHTESLRYHLSANLDSIYRELAEQIRRGKCFTCANTSGNFDACGNDAQEKALAFMARLPRIRELLALDAKAAYEGDPAAVSPGETIFCYPSLLAMTHYRIAHELRLLEVPVIPRIISEMAHSRTGIDIHPGADIGEEFFIDHGTGVVIGETCIIGRCCRLYQGVTLGALSFPKDDNGVLVKGIPRHPILEDNVTVYAGATILGRVTIGAGAIIGGNVWLTHGVEPGAKVVQQNVRPKTTEPLTGDRNQR